MKAIKRMIALFILVPFLATSVAPMARAAGMPQMAEPGTMFALTPAFTPAYLMGVTIDPKNALAFDFLINKGEVPMTDAQKRVEYRDLIKYFLAALTIPNTDQWVNLSPYEGNRIIKDNFGQTEMGRDLLAQDYILKQLTASLMHPDSDLGKKFWEQVYARAYQEYGSTDIPVDTFNKVWITPDKVSIVEKNNTALIADRHLKVMTERDYLAMDNNALIREEQGNQPPLSETSKISAAIVKEIIIPALEKEVNEGETFANLRQIYSAMILATWYKKELKESVLAQAYGDHSKVKGVDQDPKNNEAIYQQYIESFKKGVVNMIKEDVDTYTKEVVPRKYFSGGWDPKPLDNAAIIPATPENLDKTSLPKSIQEGTADGVSIALTTSETPESTITPAVEKMATVVEGLALVRAPSDGGTVSLADHIYTVPTAGLAGTDLPVTMAGNLEQRTWGLFDVGLQVSNKLKDRMPGIKGMTGDENRGFKFINVKVVEANNDRLIIRTDTETVIITGKDVVVFDAAALTQNERVRGVAEEYLSLLKKLIKAPKGAVPAYFDAVHSIDTQIKNKLLPKEIARSFEGAAGIGRTGLQSEGVPEEMRVVNAEWDRICTAAADKIRAISKIKDTVVIGSERYARPLDSREDENVFEVKDVGDLSIIPSARAVTFYDQKGSQPAVFSDVSSIEITEGKVIIIGDVQTVTITKDGTVVSSGDAAETVIEESAYLIRRDALTGAGSVVDITGDIFFVKETVGLGLNNMKRTEADGTADKMPVTISVTGSAVGIFGFNQTVINAFNAKKEGEIKGLTINNRGVFLSDVKSVSASETALTIVTAIQIITITKDTVTVSDSAATSAESIIVNGEKFYATLFDGKVLLVDDTFAGTSDEYQEVMRQGLIKTGASTAVVRWQNGVMVVTRTGNTFTDTVRSGDELEAWKGSPEGEIYFHQQELAEQSLRLSEKVSPFWNALFDLLEKRAAKIGSRRKAHIGERMISSIAQLWAGSRVDRILSKGQDVAPFKISLPARGFGYTAIKPAVWINAGVKLLILSEPDGGFSLDKYIEVVTEGSKLTNSLAVGVFNKGNINEKTVIAYPQGEFVVYDAGVSRLKQWMTTTSEGKIYASYVKKDNVGGIDFNEQYLQMNIKRDGAGVPLPIGQQDLDSIRIDGLVPVILSIQPVTTLAVLN